MGMKKFEMLNVICASCELTAKEKLVAHYFVYKSNRSGTCYPCVNTIAEQCGVSRRTIQRATKKLQERGFITIEKRFNMGRQTSNLYSFNFLLLEEMERDKEIKKESEKQVQDIAAMEVLELDEILNLENEIYEEKEEGIDLDEIAMNTYIQGEEIQWSVTEEVPFKDDEKEYIATKARQCNSQLTSKSRKRMSRLFLSVFLSAIKIRIVKCFKIHGGIKKIVWRKGTLHKKLLLNNLSVAIPP